SAIFRRRMRVDGSTQTFAFVAHLAAPALSVADKEALFGGEAFDRLELLILCVFLPGYVGEQQASEIRDVFAERQLPINFDVIDDCVIRILLRDAAGALLEFFAILGSPPVAQVSLRVELTAFIIEAVGEFVADRPSGVA